MNSEVEATLKQKEEYEKMKNKETMSYYLDTIYYLNIFIIGTVIQWNRKSTKGTT